jgi:Cu-Zn family superoxide dismutase
MSRRFTSPLSFVAVATFATSIIVSAGSQAAEMPAPHDMAAMMPAAPAITTVVAVLVPTQGNDVRGTVKFTKVAGGVRVVADITGLKPGEHGFHIHEFGDASSADGMAAGGHFNPAKENHGAPTAAVRHAGDLGNIKADANGRATLDQVDAKLSLDGAASIIGRAVVVHANPDDLTTQPTGNAGGRVAVGVIGVAKAP